MSHKVSPKIIRIKKTEDWLSRGFYNKKYPVYLKEDFLIRDYLKKKLSQALVEAIEIDREATNLKVTIKTAKPAFVIGRGGKGVETLREEIKKILEKIKEGKNEDKSVQKRNIKIEIIEVRNPWSSATLISQWVAGQLEKMVPYRRVLKMGIRKAIDQKDVQGVKIQISGRLNGVEIARTEWLKEGKLPRQKFRALIDYGFSEAHCTYGVIGVKVWVYKGDEFNPTEVKLAKSKK